MKNRLMMMGLVLSMVLGYTAQAVWAEGEVARREENQQDRIAQGIGSGQLTAGEAAHLEKGEQRIEKVRQKALSDGKITRAERIRLNKMQNRESRKIYRAKHNARRQKV